MLVKRNGRMSGTVGNMGNHMFAALSSSENGLTSIWNMWKASNSLYQSMSPLGKSVWDRWEKQFRTQYQLEIINPNSPFYLKDQMQRADATGKDTANTANLHYKNYLDAAFNPKDPTVKLWNTNDFKRTFDVFRAGMGPDWVATGDGQPDPTVKRLTNVQNPQASNPMSPMNFIQFWDLAQDIEVVKDWMIYSNTLGIPASALPSARKALRNSMDGWLMENMHKLDTKDKYGIPHNAGSARQEVSRSLAWEALVERRGNWFNPPSQGDIDDPNIPRYANNKE
jgi:hypothetical protein